MALTASPWVFTPYPALAPLLIPNTLFYNATTPLSNLTYQITLSYPFEWTTLNPTNSTAEDETEALTVYIPDGNAFSLTASEFLRRRKPVEPTQPDVLVVSIGYPLSNSVYDFPQRAIDFGAPIPPDPLVEGGAENFLEFITGSLRPWVRETIFSERRFTRDALYGHSSGGLFVTWAMANSLGDSEKGFDTYIAASPSLVLNNGTVLESVTAQLGDGVDIPGALPQPEGNVTKPAAFIAYGGYEEFPTRRRTQTEREFQTKRNFMTRLRLARTSHDLYDKLVGSGRLRDTVVKEYAGLDHASVGAAALVDGLVYFMDW
ncbi:Alpha/Beta hydrolase fold [Naviculisporaceae sp. PSN 640]